MTGTNLIKTLTAKYAKLLGEHEFAERAVEDVIGITAIIEATNQVDRQKKEIEEKLAAIEIVIWIYDPDWNPAIVRPIYSRKRRGKYGSISRAAYAVLRDADEILTTREISKLIVRKLNLVSVDERELARIDLAIYGALNGRAGRTVRIETTDPMRWSIIERENALPGTNKRVKKSGIEKNLPPAPRRRRS